MNGGECCEFDKEWTQYRTTTTVFAKCAGISAKAHDERQQLLDFVDKILADQPADPSPTRLIEYKIHLTSDEPVRHNQRRMAPMVRERVLEIVEKWSEDGIVKPSGSDYSSAPVMTR